MKMWKKLNVLPASVVFIAMTASAAIAQNADYTLAATPPAPAIGLEYQQGAFYYGTDCGGNSVMTAASGSRPCPASFSAVRQVR